MTFYKLKKSIFGLEFFFVTVPTSLKTICKQVGTIFQFTAFLFLFLNTIKLL